VTRIDPAGMAEATRLTRAGRLGEATRLIQRLLGGEPASAAGEAPFAGPTLELVPEPAGEPHDPRQGPAGHQHDSRQAPSMRQRGPRHAADGRWDDDTYANPFGQRPYWLFVPHRLPATPVPLVVMLHGCTQTPGDFARGTAMNRLAAERGCIVVYPGQVESANAQRCWNWFQPSDQERERGEPSLIAGITRRVIQSHPVDPSQVYVAGLSAGGAKAAIMAATYPDLYAAVGVHSGLPNRAARDVASAFAAMRQPGELAATAGAAARFVPTIVLHGEHDRTVHSGNAEAIVGLALAGADVHDVQIEESRVPGGHAYRRTRHLTADGRIAVEHWRIAGLGHAWSGGDPAGSYTDPRGPDASRAILDFFFGQRRPASG
jgi:poly(hydroxyalkanoate) depolymerase family esterase